LKGQGKNAGQGKSDTHGRRLPGWESCSPLFYTLFLTIFGSGSIRVGPNPKKISKKFTFGSGF
jgi:hypothetical protein